MKYAPFFGLIVLLIAMLSCKNSSPKKVKHNDPFYNDSGEGKFLVVPLIKPYRVETDEDAGIGWQLEFHEKYRTSVGVLYIEKIAVERGVIMIFAPNTPKISLSNLSWDWIVIIPERKIEEGFDNENAFLDYIRAYGIESPKWVDPLEAFKQFESTGCLEWLPDCD
jgi:hypothetical protein